MRKGQILALTIFMLFIVLGVILVLFMPINQQLIRLKKLFSVYQALASAESGIEATNLYLIKNTLPSNFQATSGVISSSVCETYFDYFCSLHQNEIPTCSWAKTECDENTVQWQNIAAKAYVYRLTNDTFYSLYSKVISQSQVKGITRVLDFDFAP